MLSFCNRTINLFHGIHGNIQYTSEIYISGDGFAVITRYFMHF